jgi:energy-coupling factor transporter ATP-binding protein EcfA2
LFAIVGPAGSGKTTLIDRMFVLHPGTLSVIRTVTNRAPRAEEIDENGRVDDKHYRFCSNDEFAGLLRDGRLVQGGKTVYNGHWYDNDREEMHERLKERFGICALVEPTVVLFRSLGYDVTMIRVTPEGPLYKPRSPERAAEDAAREKAGPWANHFMVNTFETAGYVPSAKRLANILENYLYPAKK